MEVVYYVVYILLCVIIGCILGKHFTSRKRYMKLRQELREKRDCSVCVNRGMMTCPNSSLCWSMSDKPYFEPKEEDEQK